MNGAAMMEISTSSRMSVSVSWMKILKVSKLSSGRILLAGGQLLTAAAVYPMTLNEIQIGPQSKGALPRPHWPQYAGRLFIPFLSILNILLIQITLSSAHIRWMVRKVCIPHTDRQRFMELGGSLVGSLVGSKSLFIGGRSNLFHSSLGMIFFTIFFWAGSFNLTLDKRKILASCWHALFKKVKDSSLTPIRILKRSVKWGYLVMLLTFNRYCKKQIMSVCL